MKKYFLFFALFFCLHSLAIVRTVSNNVNSIAQYNTIQAAVDASSSGDTIYVQGSDTRYPKFTITDKRLIIIGPGWSPLRNFMAFNATVDEIVINGNNCKNTEIQGIDVFMTVDINTSHPDSLRFIRNRFHSAIYLGSAGTYNGYVFQDNWFDNGWVGVSAGVNISNFLFQNNIFYCISTNGNIYGFLNSQNVLFDHNLWYGPSGTGTAPCFGGQSRYMLFTNNIFVHRNAASNNTLSVFNNNLTFAAGVNNPWDATYNNSGSGNIENQDPQMAGQSSVNNGVDNPLLDFTIAAGPANNTGTDNKDLGLLFDPSGILNWTNSRMSRLPFLYSMSISNSTVPAGNSLNVQVEARRNN
jgi:hypothetical protein